MFNPVMRRAHGGYATLVGLTFTPEVFADGVEIVGRQTCKTLLNTSPPCWEAARMQFARARLKRRLPSRWNKWRI